MGEWINGKWNSDATLAAKAAARAQPVRVIWTPEGAPDPRLTERFFRKIHKALGMFDGFFEFLEKVNINPLSQWQAHWWYAAQDGSCGGRCGLCNGEAGWGQQYAAHGYYPSRNQPNSGGVNAFDANGY